MQFNNRENRCYKTEDGDVWHSRSVAVVGLVLMIHEGEKYVLLGKRGQALPNEVGKYSLPCGYLDWNETCEQAVVREVYEETGLNLYKLVNNYTVLYDHLHFPWRINSEPDNKVQNISMHYAVYLQTEKVVGGEFAELPKLNVDGNVDPEEVSDIIWVKVSDIHQYECAFNHDNVIKVFVNSLP